MTVESAQPRIWTNVSRSFPSQRMGYGNETTSLKNWEGSEGLGKRLDLAWSGGGAMLGTGTVVVLLHCARHCPEIVSV